MLNRRLFQEFALQILKHLSGECFRINDGFDTPQNRRLFQLFFCSFYFEF